MVGDPLYALGMFRQSSVGLTVAIGDAGAGGGGGWKGKEGKRFPAWAIGVGKGGVGMQGSIVVTENWLDKFSEISSSEKEGR